jgi:hypothetical protein
MRKEGVRACRKAFNVGPGIYLQEEGFRRVGCASRRV